MERLPKPAGGKPVSSRVNSKSDAACPPSRDGNSQMPVAMDTGSLGQRWRWRPQGCCSDARAWGGVFLQQVPQRGRGASLACATTWAPLRALVAKPAGWVGAGGRPHCVEPLRRRWQVEVQDWAPEGDIGRKGKRGLYHQGALV